MKVVNLHIIKLLWCFMCFNIGFIASASETKNLENDSIALQLGEVTVTAMKSVSDLRGAAVISRKDAEQNRIATIRDASNMTPGIFMPEYGSRMTSTIYVRGLGSRIDQPSLGLTVDNVPVMNKENYDFDLLDISRVELLRGPQSSLYGRNTLAGQINVYTLSPFSWQGTRLLFEGASATAFKAGASHYNKPNDRFAWSAGLYFTSTRGQFTNEHNGKRCDWERQGNLRVKTEWRLDPSLSFGNTLSASVIRQGGYPYELQETGIINYNDTCFYRRTAVLDAFSLNKRFSAFSLSSITSYQFIDDNMTLDQDFTPEPYFTLTQRRKEHAFTQELIARGELSSSLSWLGGAFGFIRSYRMYAPVTFYDTGIRELIENHVNFANPSYPIEWLTRNFLLDSYFRGSSAGAALYTQWVWKIGKLKTTAALRADYESAYLDYNSDTETGYNIIQKATNEIYRTDIISIHETGSLSKHFFELLPRLRLDYTLRDEPGKQASVRTIVSKGYKAGGFNTQMFSDVLQQRLMGVMGIGRKYDPDDVVGYKPEKTWNFEIGGNLSVLDGRLNADVSAYYINCSDRQLTVFPDGTTTGRMMTNAGKSRSLGVEATLNYTPTKHWTFNTSYSLCDARFVEYNDGRGDYADKRVPYAPKHTLFVQGLFTTGCGSIFKQAASITLDAHVKAAGNIYWNEDNSLSQPFYALLGASATLETKRFALQLWGENLTNTRYHTFYFMSIGHKFLQRGKRLQAGATLRINI